MRMCYEGYCMIRGVDDWDDIEVSRDVWGDKR